MDGEGDVAEEDDQPRPDTEPTAKQPLSWLMSRTSFLARRLIIDRPSSHIAYLQTEWTRPVMSIFRFFAGVYEVLSEKQAKQFSRHVLAPVYRVLDEGGDLGDVEKDQAVGTFTISRRDSP
jgi:U3 small nucleolar RNA-associated protein 20